MSTYRMGDLVQTFFTDTGSATPGNVYGIVTSAGPKRVGVTWESGRRQSLHKDRWHLVKPVPDDARDEALHATRRVRADLLAKITPRLLAKLAPISALVCLIACTSTASAPQQRSGQPPMLSSCGSSPSVVASFDATNLLMKIHVGLHAPACTVTFAEAWDHRPKCSIVAIGMGQDAFTWTTSTTGFVLNAPHELPAELEVLCEP